MAILTAGSSITLTLTDSDSVTINTAGVLTLTAVSGLGVAAGKLGEFTGSRTFGPYAAGQLQLDAGVKDCYYEVADAPVVSKSGAQGSLLRRLRLAYERAKPIVPLAAVTTATVTGSWTPALVPSSGGQYFAYSEQTFTVAAMNQGDVVTNIVPPSSMPTGLVVHALRLHNATTVGVTFRIGSGSSVIPDSTPPAGTWTVTVARFAGGLPADAPVVTMSAQGAATSLTNTKTYTYLDTSNIRMRHPVATDGTVGTNYVYSSASSRVGDTKPKKSYICGVEFMIDEPKFEILVSASRQPIDVIVDGKIVTPAPILMGIKGDGGYRLLVDFTQGGTIATFARKLRKVRIEMGNFGHFGGLVVPKTATVSVPKSAAGVLGMVFSDSYGEGIANAGATGTAHPLLAPFVSGSAYTTNGFANRIGDAMGWDECVVSGVASTGYLATGVGSTVGYKWRDRIEDMTKATVNGKLYVPDVVYVFGSINDANPTNAFTPAQLQAEVAAFYAAATTALPNTIFIVFGLQHPNDSYNDNGRWNVAIQNGIAAVGSQNTFFVDPTSWVTGTGCYGSATGVGSSDVNTCSDATHNTFEGHNVYTYQTAQSSGAIIKANA